nr:F0F1 ATP synthase subunit A [Stackebrandtia nassauensis]
MDDFFLPDFVTGRTDTFWATKITSLVVLAVIAVIAFYVLSYRKPQLVPTKKQWIAESAYGFIRNNVVGSMLGEKDTVRFAPYMATLFSFIAVMNIMGIIPGIQMSPSSHIAFPTILAVVSYVMFNYVGIKKFGFVKYMKHTLIPPAPIFVMPLLIPIEFFSNLIIRPVTLALRLFANLFAGHIILLVFTLGGFAMINANGLLFPVSIVSWAMTVALTFLEAFIAILQAYMFVVLSTSYIQGALAEEH